MRESRSFLECGVHTPFQTSAFLALTAGPRPAFWIEWVQSRGPRSDAHPRPRCPRSGNSVLPPQAHGACSALGSVFPISAALTSRRGALALGLSAFFLLGSPVGTGRWGEPGWGRGCRPPLSPGWQRTVSAEEHGLRRSALFPPSLPWMDTGTSV